MENKWIDINDRFPEKTGFYIVNVDKSVASLSRGTVEIGECFHGVINKDNNLLQVIRFHDYVTHWMPLPSPPHKP